MPPRAVLIALAVVAVVAASVWSYSATYTRGYQAGELHERTAARAAADARQREDQRLASQLAATARAEATAARDNAHRLQMELTHGRTALVRAGTCVPGRADVLAAVPADGVPAAGAAEAGAPGGAADRAAAGDDPSARALPRGVPEDGGIGLSLTADALRLWNSALAGRATAAGACGAADAPAGACAADTGVTLAEAWANHIENAARCGQDRINHRRLIEFIRERNARQAQAEPAVNN